MIVKSLLEQDLYKFTMWQALLHSHPEAEGEYNFVCRNKPEFPLADLKEGVEKELDHLCNLRFTEDELDYLRGLRFIKSDFVDFLSLFRFQRKFIQVSTEGETLKIVAKGPIVHVMTFEIFVLYIVNELYFNELNKRTRTNPVYQIHSTYEEGRKRLDKKISRIRQHEDDLVLFDFGLRRRYSNAWHEEVLTTLEKEVPKAFRGTSNVYLAKKLGLIPIGTMAHEYLQAYQSFGFRLRDFQKAALEGWVQEYRGDLGYALTDVVGMDAFLDDFDLYFAKLFDGLRHDSGDPIVWGEKALAHYAKLGVDAHTKTLTFSDSLDIPRVIEICDHFKDRVKTNFGIGTNLTNDLGPEPLNIVMKIVACNGQPVAKLSDSQGKTLCQDTTFLAYLQQVFSVKSDPMSYDGV